MADGNHQPDLLDYPRTPGWQNTETSIEAAAAIAPDLTRLQGMVLDAIRDADWKGGLTADEVAMVLDLTPFTARPRCAELKVFGKIEDSGSRRENESGRRAIVWVVVGEQESGALRQAQDEVDQGSSLTTETQRHGGDE